MNALPIIASINSLFEGPGLIIIFLIIILLFGGSKLPSLAKGIGKSVREFKKATETDDDDDDDDEEEDDRPKKSSKKKPSAAKTEATAEAKAEDPKEE